MEGWQIVIVILAAVLVGALLPVLFQVFTTLRAIRTNVERLGPKIDQTLGEVQDATRRLNRTGASIEQGVDQVRSVVSTAGEAARLFHQVKGSLRTAATVGGAVGPAIVAAVRAISGAPPATSNGRSPDTGPPDQQGDTATEAPESPAVGRADASSSTTEETKGETA